MRGWRTVPLAVVLALAGVTPAHGADTTLTVSDSAGRPGRAGVAVRVMSSAPITIGSSDLILTFDPSALTATAASSSTLSGFTAAIDPIGGTVTTASASAGGQSIPAGGVLFEVTFDVPPSAASGEYPLGLVDGDGLPNDLGGVPPPIPAVPVTYAVQEGTFTVRDFDTTLAVSTAAAVPGQSDVEIEVATLFPIIVGATDVVLLFDPAVLVANSVTSTTLSSFTSSIDNNIGRIATASASSSGNSLLAGDKLFTVEFDVRGDAPGGSHPITLADADGPPNDLAGVAPPIPAPALSFDVVDGSVVLPTSTATETPTITPTPEPTRTSTPAGSPTPTGIGIAGTVRYYATGEPLAGVTVELSGPQALTTTTTAAGGYRFDGIPAGTWEVAASFAAQPRTGISAYDAAFALQAVVATRSFSPDQTLACDVNGDGQMTANDVDLLLRYRVGLDAALPIAERCGASMLFRPVPVPLSDQQAVLPQVDADACTPGKIVLEGLSSWAFAQDFDAVLLGDCTGNWSPQ